MINIPRQIFKTRNNVEMFQLNLLQSLISSSSFAKKRIQYSVSKIRKNVNLMYRNLPESDSFSQHIFWETRLNTLVQQCLHLFSIIVHFEKRSSFFFHSFITNSFSDVASAILTR